MITPLVCVAGAAYGLVLWFIAQRVARKRGLVLGSLPHWILAVCGVAPLAIASLMPLGAALPMSASFIGAVICALVDARTGLIFNALSLAMVVVAAGLSIAAGRVVDDVVAATVVGGAMAGLYFATAKRGIGFGDVKLSSAIALGYGLSAALVAIGSAFILGALYATAMLACGRVRRNDALRFGPFIAGGAAVGVTAAGLGWYS